jgi:hypothetical protein
MREPPVFELYLLYVPESDHHRDYLPTPAFSIPSYPMQVFLTLYFPTRESWIQRCPTQESWNQKTRSTLVFDL